MVNLSLNQSPALCEENLDDSVDSGDLSVRGLWWRHGVVVITTTQLHSTKPELRFCAGSNPAHGVSEIHDGEDL